MIDMKRLLISILLAVTVGFSNDFVSPQDSLHWVNDSLSKNRTKLRNSPEYWIQRSNLKVQLANLIVLENGTSKKKDALIAVNETNDTISMVNGYNPEIILEAKALLDSGTTLFPNRIDIWIGKSQLYGVIDRCESQDSALSLAYGYFKKNPKKLVNGMGEKIENVDALIENEYRLAIMNYWNEENDKCVMSLAKGLNRILPKSVVAYNFLGVEHMLNNNDSALVYFNKALQFDKSDPVVLGNIAEFYFRKGDCANVKKYAGMGFARDPAMASAYSEKAKQCEERKK